MSNGALSERSESKGALSQSTDGSYTPEPLADSGLFLARSFLTKRRCA
jgi:hypothetical protein